MDRRAFSQFRDEHFARIQDINDKKGKDYAGDEDALANFKLAAEQLGLTPEQVWGVYFHKHHSAVQSYLRHGQVESEPIEGRIHDCILYLFLLLGLIEDGKSDAGDPVSVLSAMGPEPATCGDKRGSYVCQLNPGHVGEHYDNRDEPYGWSR